MAGRNRLACFGGREKGTCDNRLTIRRDEVEARVLSALEEKLLNQELFDEFCDEFTREMNRLRMEHRASLSAAEREIERIEMSMGRLNHFGGAMSRIADDATPFPHRQARFAFSPDALWNKPEEAAASVQWAKGYWQALRAYSPRGAYVNFMEDEGPDRVRESYRGNYDRLVQIKRRYDPTNLFRLNQNIKP